jgi:tetratricopeptide (TPR) repeat protein/two-component sensor histidine kinase
MFKTILILIFISVLPGVLFASPEKTVAPQMNKTPDTLELAKEWFKKAGVFDGEGNTEKANEAAHEALRLATAINDRLMMGRSMNFLAINLSAEGKRAEGIVLSYKAFENLMLAGDTVRAANVKINLGMDYNNDGKYQEALKVELEALDLRLKCGDSTNIAAYYQRIGEVYKELGVHDKWKSSLETAHRLSANPKYASFATQIGILNDYGGIYEAEKRYDEAIKVYLDMYSRSKKENYLNGIATSLTNLSPVYRNMGQNEKALECIKGALEIQIKRESDYGILTAYNQLGEVYYAMGQLTPAYSNFLQGYDLALKTNYIINQQESLKGLYRVARKQSNWKEALVFHEKLVQLKDSMQNIDLQEKLTDIETKYQTEKKEQQIELLNRDNELKSSRLKFQKLAIWGGSLFFLILAAFVFFGVRQSRKQQIVKQNELEQKLLRSQMNPHFIFNSLGAIQNFMMKNDGRKAAFYLSSFSSLMRSILKNSREELITLQEEKQTLENYLNLHQLRLGDKLSFSVSVSSGLDAETIMLPPMLIQPFVENAILHGVEKMGQNGCVAIAFSIENDQLVISVEDNGKGFESGEQKENHISYALQIFKERVANLKKTLGTEILYRIENSGIVENQNLGTLVTVKLPLKINRYD